MHAFFLVMFAREADLSWRVEQPIRSQEGEILLLYLANVQARGDMDII